MVYAFVVAASLGFKYAIPEGNAELVKWVTAFFFGANALEHFAGKVGLKVGNSEQ